MPPPVSPFAYPPLPAFSVSGLGWIEPLGTHGPGMHDPLPRTPFIKSTAFGGETARTLVNASNATKQPGTDNCVTFPPIAGTPPSARQAIRVRTAPALRSPLR